MGNTSEHKNRKKKHDYYSGLNICKNVNKM